MLFFLATARIRFINACSSEISIEFVSEIVVNIFEPGRTDNDHALDLLGVYEIDNNE